MSDPIEQELDSVRVPASDDLRRRVINHLSNVDPRLPDSDLDSPQMPGWRITGIGFAAVTLVVFILLAKVIFVSNEVADESQETKTRIVDRPKVWTVEMNLEQGRKTKHKRFQLGENLAMMKHSGGKIAWIKNRTTNRMLTITDHDKKAILSRLPRAEQKGASVVWPALLSGIDIFDPECRIFDPKNRVGDKVIGGIQSEVFEIKQDEVTSRVFVDPKTKRPIQSECSFDNPQLGKTQLINRDFNFDIELKESMFEMKAPEGYKLVNTVNPSIKTDDWLLSQRGAGPIRFGMSRIEVEDRIGKADDVRDSSPPKNYKPQPGEIMVQSDIVTLGYYSAGGFTITLSARFGVVAIHCVNGDSNIAFVSDFAGQTHRGGKLGMTLEAFEAAQGESQPVPRQDSLVVQFDQTRTSAVAFPDDQLEVRYRNGIVTEMLLYGPDARQAHLSIPW